MNSLSGTMPTGSSTWQSSSGGTAPGNMYIMTQHANDQSKVFEILDLITTNSLPSV